MGGGRISAYWKQGSCQTWQQLGVRWAYTKLADASNAALFLQCPGVSQCSLHGFFPRSFCSRPHPALLMCRDVMGHGFWNLRQKCIFSFAASLKIYMQCITVYSCGCRLIKQQEEIAETISTPVREGKSVSMQGTQILNGEGYGK